MTFGSHDVHDGPQLLAGTKDENGHVLIPVR